MKTIKIMAVATLSVFAASGALAQTSTLGSSVGGDRRFTDASTNSLPTGTIVRLGNFGTNAISTITTLFSEGNLAGINALFEELTNWTFSAPGIWAFSEPSLVSIANFASEEAYLLVYNVTSLANVNTATQFGVFEFATGNFPTGINPDQVFTWNPSISSVAPIIGFEFDGPGTQDRFGLAVIPEPGTVAALLAGLIALPFVRRMRKNS